MNIKSNIKYIFLLLVFVQCKEKKEDTLFKKINTPYTICLQPFADIDSTIVMAIKDSIQKIYSLTKINANEPLPAFAFYKKNNRYKADSLLTFLNLLRNENELMVGLTNKDISTTKDNIEDWGVMGLGKCPGYTCVASTFRLKKENIKSQFFKVAIHELGHTQGLPHCENTTCYMRDAEGKNTTNEEIGFCIKCKTFLINKNWKL